MVWMILALGFTLSISCSTLIWGVALICTPSIFFIYQSVPFLFWVALMCCIPSLIYRSVPILVVFLLVLLSIYRDISTSQSMLPLVQPFFIFLDQFISSRLKLCLCFELLWCVAPPHWSNDLYLSYGFVNISRYIHITIYVAVGLTLLFFLAQFISSRLKLCLCFVLLWCVVAPPPYSIDPYLS